MGPGEELHGAYFRSVQLNGYGPKTRIRSGRVLLKGPVSDIMLRHCVACDTYRKFGDAVYIMIPVYHDEVTTPKKGGGSSFTVTKLPSSLEPKGQRPLSLPHSP